jgi:hypothetical protein
MEILRFEEAPSDAPKRKKSSRSFLALGLVATLFGVSTAFATTTININDNKTISLGQGVNTFTACDTAVGLEPVTSLKNDLTLFQFEKLIVGSNYDDGLTDETHQEYRIDSHSPDPVSGLGCGGVDFKVKFYLAPSSVPLTCQVLLQITDSGFLKTSPTATILEVTQVDNKYKCDDSAIYFKIPDNLLVHTQLSPEIKFLKLPSPDFFDHVTIETTSSVDYASLT